ncbi:hypothetical protein PSECIP111951_03095 [Pseudoalteromonas holothuriae]|uniref:DUF3530 domain-containing protein n=1 Tax=Pseudoalteromonas holothuriae TaxID=2963714 RepID=A0A9W4QZ76_9GAMM|nr:MULTISPECIES: alpha/beta hydrolase family protein [unclassified Pseudoalteromonas]CAH9059521.1 hypothetical protein PSECIP111854_02423 [Pseudoalteromonas sp. CIP111854]CAH9064291.1 hypothetical protein PSECIP111951_03095 [Pseudoalteromonas sp. CIP111951]
MSFVTCVLCVLVLTISGTSDAASAQFVMPEPSVTIEQRDLVKYFPDKLIELETDEGKILTLFSPYMSASKRGVAIILPGAGQGPLSVHGLSYLSQALTDDGFDTYAVQTPHLNWQADLLQVDPITTQNEEAAEADYTGPWSEPMLNDYKEQLLASFDVLYNQLQMTNQEQLVVIAHGVSAGVFSEYLASLPNIRIDAFVTVSAQLPNTKRNKHLPAVLSLVSPPLLDIIYSQDTQSILDNAKQRIRWVKRNNKYDYRQRELFGISTEPRQHQRLRKELDGFLRQL